MQEICLVLRFVLFAIALSCFVFRFVLFGCLLAPSVFRFVFFVDHWASFVVAVVCCSYFVLGRPWGVGVQFVFRFVFVLGFLDSLLDSFGGVEA